MKANRKHSETGLVGYDLAKPRVRRLTGAMRDHYMKREHSSATSAGTTASLWISVWKKPDAPKAPRDVAKRAVANAEVLPTTPFAPYLEHEKGLHSREARTGSLSQAARIVDL